MSSLLSQQCLPATFFCPSMAFSYLTAKAKGCMSLRLLSTRLKVILGRIFLEAFLVKAAAMALPRRALRERPWAVLLQGFAPQ